MIKKTLITSVLFFCLFVQRTIAQKPPKDQNPKDTMTYYRGQIDTLDKQITTLLGKRMDAARAIGIYKMDHKIAVVQSARFEEVLNNAVQRGKTLGLSEEFIRALYNDIHAESVRQQEQLQKEYKKD